MMLMFYFIFLLITIFYFLFIINNPQLIQETVYNTTSIFLKVIIPSLFPSFIISNLFIHNQLCNKLFNKLNQKLKLFNNGYSLLIYTNSLLVGNPTTAYLYTKGYNEGLISKEDLIKLTTTTNYINPLLLLSIFKNTMFVVSIVLFFIVINTTILLFYKF